MRTWFGRPRRWTLVAVVVVLAIITGGVLVAAEMRSSTEAGLSNEATVRASSSAAGFSPQDAVYDVFGSWRSDGEAAGAWIELDWDAPRRFRHVLIERGPLTQPGPLAGFLTFGDGSRLAVTLSTVVRTTRVPISPRRANSVRFTVSQATQGAASVEITQFAVDDQERPNLVETGGDVTRGNVAPAAIVTSSTGGSRASLGPLTDGSPTEPGDSWRATAGEDDWIQLAWSRPRELSTISVSGVESEAQLGAATLEFSDGSTVALGGVLPNPTLPTAVSFMPRSASSVRLTFDALDGVGELALAELSVLERGAPALADSGPPTMTTAEGAVDQCGSPGERPDDFTGVVVLCPTVGTVVGDTVEVVGMLGPSYTSLSARAWPSVAGIPLQPLARASVTDSGSVAVTLSLAGLPRGPMTINVTANGVGADPRQVYLQVQLTEQAAGADMDVGESTNPGRTLVYREEFTGPISISRNGTDATYLAGKPEVDYTADFAEGIFADPADGLGNLQVVGDDFLRIAGQPRPPEYADPRGYGREFVGGLLASGRPGGSGFSAQYGYFEARMLLPAGLGTWPAFWMLPSPNLVEQQPVLAEIDALEHYGIDPTSTCHVTHVFRTGRDSPVNQCGKRWASTRAALVWHTFAVDISPTGVSFLIDGVEVAKADQVDGGDEPLFFLLNLALGGGFPIDLTSTRGYADLYVDYIRVYV